MTFNFAKKSFSESFISSLVLVFAFVSLTFGVRVMDCRRNAETDVYGGAIMDPFPFRSLDKFTMCVRFQFFQLTFNNIIFMVKDSKGTTRPLLQTEIFVDKLRFSLSHEYKQYIVDTWLQPEQWYHVCVTHDPLLDLPYNFYLDGKYFANSTRKLEFDEALVGKSIQVGFKDLSIREGKFFGNVTQLDIWEYVLTTDQIFSLAKCQQNFRGDILDWESDNWTFYNVTLHEVDVSLFCAEQNNKYYVEIMKPMNYYEGAFACEGIRGSLYTPRNIDEIHKFFDSLDLLEGVKGCFLFWIGVWDPKEGIWEFHSNGSISENITWASDEPNGLHSENCGGLDYEGIVDDNCEKDRCPVCLLKVGQPWKLFGACATLTYNINFMRINLEDEIIYRGYGSYKIQKQDGKWIWIDDGSTPSLIATLEPKKFNYPLGRQTWRLNKPLCNQKKGETRTLLLTACESDKFTCDDGTCIPHRKRCDLKYDCRDNSDESDCILVRFPSDYKAKVVPRGKGNDVSPVEVLTKVELESIMVDTNKMQLDVSFNFSMRWLENRVSYINLKHDLSLNFVDATDPSLWSPSVYFVNTLNHATTVIDQLTSTYVIRRKKEEYTSMEDDTPESNELFSGEHNPLESNRRYQASFTCDFDLMRYPFDTQSCNMKFLLKSGTMNVIRFGNKSTAEYSVKSTLLEYEVGPLKLEKYFEGGYDGVQVVVPLLRRHGYAFINIYLPSLTMLIIGFLTLFFKRDIFEVRIMTSLTTLLVVATLFTQIAASLPKTSYFKMVDIWFLFCIFSTFFVIVFHILIDSAIPGNDEHETYPNKSDFYGRSLNNPAQVLNFPKITAKEAFHKKSNVYPYRSDVLTVSEYKEMNNRNSPADRKGKEANKSTENRKFDRVRAYLKNQWFMEKIGQYFMAVGFLIFNAVYWMAIYVES